MSVFLFQDSSMHIPSGMLQGAVCPVTAAISSIGIATTAYAAYRSSEKPTATRFAAVSALIFAAQMVNFPVLSGTSGHLIGGVLAASLLGIPFGILSLAMVLAVQCLAFSDGGLSALGANIFNMSLIGAGIGGWIASRFSSKGLGIVVASWLSVVLASVGCSVELAMGGSIEWGKVFPAMTGVHALIGIGEAVITLAAWYAVNKVSAVQPSRSSWIVALSAAMVALLLAPFASSYPDGLEWIAEKYQFMHESVPAFTSPFADYSVAALGSGMLSVVAAGLIGVAITFATCWLATLFITKRSI